MKNLRWQTRSSDREAYIRQQISADICSLLDVRKLISEASELPIIWFDYTDESIERLHFSVWWGCIGLRQQTYSNSRIRDLYFLHELTHLVQHAQYSFPQDFDTFCRQRIQEERQASFFSEIHIYNLMPELRTQTFDFPILWDEISDLSEADQRHARIACESAAPQTPAQALVHKYAADNASWCKIWQKDYAAVEQLWRSLVETHDFGRHICALSGVSIDSVPWANMATEFRRYLVPQSVTGHSVAIKDRTEDLQQDNDFAT